MAEDSAYWAGEVTGDAASADVWDAPYTSLEWSDIWKKSLTSDVNYGLVVPDYDNELEVTAKSPASMNVAVDSGVMFIRGKMYENTASNDLAIGANASGNPRIDRVVIRISFAAQTIRMAVLAGTPGVAPALPTLTQNAATYEVPLAYIWVPNGAASIPDTDIHDERTFGGTSGNQSDVVEALNLTQNSEFMAFSQLSGGATTNPPDSWDLTGTPSDIDEDTAPSQMIRGRSIAITADTANEGIEQTINVKATTSYAIKLLAYVTAGDVGSIVVTTDAGTPGTITRYIRRETTWVEETVYYTTEADATELTVQCLCLNSGDVIKYGQVIIVEGHIPGPFKPFRETIYFTEPITDTSWDGDAKGDATTTIDLDADFQALVLPDTRNVLAVLTAQDTTSIGDIILAEYATANQNISVPLRGPSGAGATETSGVQTGSTSAIGDAGGQEFQSAQSLQCTAGRLSQITFDLSANVGTPSGDINWSLREDDAGDPAAASLVSGTITPVASATNTINIADGPYLDAGTPYWIVLYTTAQATNNYYAWTAAAVGTYANGNRAYSSDGGSTWTHDGRDCEFTLTTDAVSVADKLAQSFQCTAGTCDLVKLYLKKTGTPTGTLTLRVETDNAGDPSGTLVNANATITVGEATVTSGYTQIDFDFTTGFSLAAGTTYWLVLSTDRASSTTNYILWGSDSSPAYASGEMKSEAAAAWSAESKDACFEVVEVIAALTSQLSARRYGQTADIVLLSLVGLADSVDYQAQGWVSIDRSNRFDLYTTDTTANSIECDVKLLGINI